MSRLFYHVMQDNAGNLLFDVSGTMRLAGTGTLATIYGDNALTVPIANPMTNHPSFGSFKCYLPNGAFDFYMAKAGYTFETLTGVQGLGTMAQQNASAVAINGGNIDGLSTLAVSVAPGTAFVSGTTRLNAAVGIQQAPVATVMLSISHNKSAQYGAQFQATGADTGTQTVLFKNVAGTEVGSISTTAAATAYNTASDVRLKHAITPLTGALDVVRALRPVAFRWRADDSRGHGFLAGEVQEVIPDGVITGDRGAIDEEGNILPQQIDMSKLVPWLTAALKEALERIDVLTARLDAAGA